MDKTELEVELNDNLAKETDHVILVDDSLLLQSLSADVDIFDMYSDFAGEPISLNEYLIPGKALKRNLPLAIIYGVPKSKWKGFKDFVENLIINYKGKKYEPFLIEGRTKDINPEGKYKRYKIMPIYLISLANFADSISLKPIKNPETDVFAFQWISEKQNKIKKGTRRASMSNTLRFEIFQRDDLTCVYCNTHKDDLPSGVSLTIDHRIPYSRGGDDSWGNLVTACSECNQGKSNKIIKNL